MIHVNGGAGDPNGYDIQNGVIVAIGSNVQIWLTPDSPDGAIKGDHVPDCADPSQIHYYDASGNANANSPSGSTNIFVVGDHTGGYYQQGDWTNDHYEFRETNGITGGSGTDHIFVTGDSDNYNVNVGANNNNVLDNVTITDSETGQGLFGNANQVEDVVFGDGSTQTNTSTTTEVTFNIDVDLESSNENDHLTSITISGLPEGATFSDGVHAEWNAEQGTYTLTFDDDTTHYNGQVSVTLPDGQDSLGDIELEVHSTADDQHDTDYTFDGETGEQIESHGLQATSLNGEESEHHGAAIPDDGQEHSHSESHENAADTSQASEHGDSLDGDTDTSQSSEHGDSLDGDTDTSQASEHGDTLDSDTDASQSPNPVDSQDSGADVSQTAEHGETADSNADASQEQSDASSADSNDEQTQTNNEAIQTDNDSHADEASNTDHSLLIDDDNLLIQQGDSGSVQQASDTRSEASLSNLLGDEHDDTHAAGEESAADSQADAGQETGVTLSDAAPINFADVISDDEDGNDLSALIKVTGEDSASEPDHVPAESGALDGEGGDSGYDGGHDDHLDNLIAKPDPHA